VSAVLSDPPAQAATGRRARGWPPLLAVLVVTAFVLVVGRIGRRLGLDGTVLHLLGGWVLRGEFDVVWSARVWLPVVLALVGVLAGPVVAARLPWRALLPASALAAAGWAVALARTSGPGRLTEPLAVRYEYPHDVPRVGSISAYLSGFVDSVPAGSADPWTTHVAGHPPGALLAFVLLDRVGLGGLGWAAAMCVAGGALAVPAVLVGVRAVAGEDPARTAAPFLVLAPVALWVATSADALFAGVAAWGVALLATAAARAPGRAADLRALAGGLLLGLALFLSFGLTALGLVVLVVVGVHRPRLGWGGVVRVLAGGAVGVLVVVAAFAVGGYWWVDGFSAAGDRVRSGPSYADRPLTYFLVANLAAAALALGPAAVAGLASLRRTRLALVPLAALAGMLVSDVSGLVRGETERIWLPFYVWVLAATAFLPRCQRRAWLLLSAVLAIGIEVVVRTEW
jgi:methylthioxylose transferase